MTTVLSFRASALQEERAHDRILPASGRTAGHRALPVADGLIAFLAATALRPWGGLAGTTPGARVLTAAALAAAWVGLLAAAGSYDTSALGRAPSTRTLLPAALLPLAVLVPAALRGAPVDAPRLVALTAAVAASAFAQHVIADHLARRTASPARTVVAGHPHGVRWMLDDLRAADRLSVVAVCLTEPSAEVDFDVPVLTGFGNVRAWAAAHATEAVVVVPCPHVDPMLIRRLGWDLDASGADGPDLFVTTGLPEVRTERMRVTAAGPVPLVRLRPAQAGPASGVARVSKLAGERTLAALGLVVLAPLLLLLAGLVRAESPGPAVFRQTRIGKDGVAFTMLKLRTMRADAAELQAALSAQTPADLMLFKLRADPRITRLGRFLRTYSLDELPQLVNVVLGQMALVGPRPALPCEVGRYDADAFRRLTVTPGMTGLWQVSGRSDLSWEESLRLDLRYVDDWSPGLDARILLRTAGAVVGHRGAY